MSVKIGDKTIRIRASARGIVVVSFSGDTDQHLFRDDPTLGEDMSLQLASDMLEKHAETLKGLRRHCARETDYYNPVWDSSHDPVADAHRQLLQGY